MFQAIRRHGTAATLVLTAGLMTGCVTPNPEKATIAAAPKTSAAKTFTSFTPALRCMDEMFLNYGKKDILLTTSGIADSTGKVSVGTKEMLISALNQMSRRSKAIGFVDYDRENREFFVEAAKAAGQGHDIPPFYLRGAITQLDDNALESQVGASIALPFADLGLSKDQIVSLVTVDMNLGETVSRRIMADASSSNTMAVVRSGMAGEGGGKISKAGVNINVSLNRSEGLGAAVRALIELGLIESLGQFTKVPYWKCLQIEKTNPKMREQARDWYDGMAPQEQVSFVQRKLSAAGVYGGAVTGVEDAATKEAVARYQSQNGLIADGRVNFDLYYDLLDGEQKLPQDSTATRVALTAPRPSSNPLSVTLDSDRGTAPTYRLKEFLRARAVLSRPGFLMCYYEDAGGTVARLFPNRFQPNAYVTDNAVLLASEQSPVKIRFDKGGVQENITCLASDSELVVPANLKQKDLTPLPVRSMDDLLGQIRQLNPQIGTAKLAISVQ